MAATKGEAAAGSNAGTGGTEGTATQSPSPLSTLMDGLPLGKLLGK
jgi:hypothetical protein